MTNDERNDSHRDAILAVVALISLITCGCIYEPYPAFQYRRMTAQQLPPFATDALCKQYPDSTIQAVEQRDFKGKTIDYSVLLSHSSGDSQVVRITPDGTASGVPEVRREPPFGQANE
jgi:hypothetical protein